MSPSSNHLALIGVRTFSNEGIPLLRDLVHGLGLQVGITKVSSIYRVHGVEQRPRHVHDLRAVSLFEALTLSVLATTEYSPSELAERLQALEDQFSNEVMRRSVSVILYFFDDVTMMTPQLTLPYTGFHLEAACVLPSAEVTPDYIHPVLQKSLRELGQSFDSAVWGEFLSQGKAVLDFYPS